MSHGCDVSFSFHSLLEGLTILPPPHPLARARRNTQKSLALFCRVFGVICGLAGVIQFVWGDLLAYGDGVVAGSNSASASDPKSCPAYLSSGKESASCAASAAASAAVAASSFVSTFTLLIFYLVSSVLKLHSTSLIWGVAVEALGYERELGILSSKAKSR